MPKRISRSELDSIIRTVAVFPEGAGIEKSQDAIEAQMNLNHKAAIEFLVEQAAEIGFNIHTILNLHALLSDNLLADPKACSRLR